MDIEIVFPGGKRVDAVYKGFTIRTDQPPQAGGEGTAPSSFDLFLASIGTCAGFYVLSFCQERDLPTEGMRLVQTMERDPQRGTISQIDIEIQLPEGFPAKYKEAAVRSVEACTVKKHLHDPPAINVHATVGEANQEVD